MYSSIYSLQSSTQRLPIQALFGFTLKATKSYSVPFLSEFVCVLVLGPLALGRLTQICLSCGKMITPGNSKPHSRRSRRQSKVSCIDCRTLIYGHYSHYLQLFSMIKCSRPCPAIQLSSHRPNWFKRAIMKSLQILPCLSLRKSPCPSTFMWVYLTIWLPCEF